MTDQQKQFAKEMIQRGMMKTQLEYAEQLQTIGALKP